MYIFICLLRFKSFCRVTATVHGTTMQALNSTSPHERCVGSLTSHRIYMCKGCEMGPMVYCPYLQRIQSLTLCKCIYKGRTFSSVIEDPECCIGRVEV